MFFEDLIDLDAPNNFKIRRSISPPDVKNLKRTASEAELKFKEKQLRPFKRQALEHISSSESEIFGSESLEAIFTNLELYDERQDEGGEDDADLVKPFADLNILNLEDATFVCPFSIPKFKEVSFIDFYNEWSYSDYFEMLPSHVGREDNSFSHEAVKFFEQQPMIKHLVDAFAVDSLKSLFHVFERSCNYTLHNSIERTLLFEPDWINPILSIIFELYLVPDIFEKTIMLLLETKATQIDLEIINKACFSCNRRFSPETFIHLIKEGVSTNILSLILAYSTIDGSVLEAAIADQRPPLLVSLLAQKVSDISVSLVMRALTQEYPDSLINQLLGACTSPEFIQAARSNSKLFDNLTNSNRSQRY